ncbi:heterokaryon incompatibility protein-domain-containing protein [Hyaloscypha sp. PMI_1271]|nr:heterokaryon incompatibility protein-domain-containing protein [Hyaloscypha sp. PMI_1271]
MNQYQYHPLPPNGEQIRLVVLLPDPPQAHIRIQIVVVPFSSSKPPPYEALSYAWGKKVNPMAIVVEPPSVRLPRRHRGSSAYLRRMHEINAGDGHKSKSSSSFAIEVLPNLDSALKHLRLADRARVLWVDAICINQPDEEEKKREVWRMGDIYRAARRVVVFLGPETSCSTLAIKTLSHLGHQVIMDWANWKLGKAPGRRRDWSKSSCILPYDETKWRAINSMLNLEWFQRLWIWQEILSARTAILVWGNSIMSWWHFRRAIACLQGNEKSELPGALATPQFRENLRRVDDLVARHEKQKQNVLDLLHRSRTSLCEISKDRIYAIMNIPSPTFYRHTTRIEPDYGKSDLEVYRQFALGNIRFHSLNLLEYAFVPFNRPRDENWPSWVPDWSNPPVYKRALSGHAGGRMKSEFTYCAVDHTLTVPGVYCGTIKYVGDPVHISSTREEILAKIHLWEPSDLFDADYPSGGKLIDAFVATMIAGGHGSRRAGQSDRAKAIQAGHRVLKYATHDVSIDSTEMEWDLAYLRFLDQFVPGQAFFRTEEDHIGLAHPHALPGDQIFLIVGCHILKVLRQKPTPQGNRYSIIGTSCLQGFMNGEALLGKMPENWDVREGRGLRDMRGLYFVNTVTGESTRMDPRLSSVYPGWVSRVDDYAGLMWRNEDDNKEWDLYDPRLSTEALKSRGVNVVDIRVA